MSRKRKAPVRKVYPDPKFHSEVVSKFINSIMYDGKRSTAEKILYDALDKIKSKNNDELKIGDKIFEELPQVDFGRIAAQSAKQVISSGANYLFCTLSSNSSKINLG